MARLFGTDGVRGLANDLLTPTLAVQLGEAAARVLTKDASAPASRSGRPRAIVGRDTRASGEFLDHAISAGLASSGVD
ncbi:phosphoglucosamine mutase, partial [Streptococcus danieliae]|nr:phosphoglucosamine mutase [Streptococcus danieliae]